MYLQKLSITGFKNFSSEFNIEFLPGLSVLVGENGAGKSAIIDAIRHLLLEDEFGRAGISDADFHRPFTDEAISSESIQMTAIFGELTPKEQIAYLPWTKLGNQAKLNFLVENKTTNQGRFRRIMWGGESRNSMFEWELLDFIHCIYLPPLRDAESKLKEGKGSRLARLLKKLNKRDLEIAKEKNSLHPLEEKVNQFNTVVSPK